jgi:hypothetical protein
MKSILAALVVLILPLLTLDVAIAGDDAPKAAGAIDLSGKWNSNFGPVTFQQDGESITGSYDENTGGVSHPGKITYGRINLATRTVVLIFYQDWSKTDGSATLKLSKDGKQLEGTSTEMGLLGNHTLPWKMWRD